MIKCTSKDIFIEKANLIHNNLYKYDVTNYINTSTKVDIFCHIHGIFTMTPNKHLNGRGCQKCSKIKSFLTQDEFIKKSKEKHSKYTYDNAIYTKGSNYIIVTCPKHGDFNITAAGHLNGRGCTKCANENKKHTNEIFINNAINKYGNLYDYSLVIYKGALTKVKIICPIHGEFSTTPNKHIRGQGCLTCKREEKIYNKIEDFKQKSSILHNNKYDYKLVKFNTVFDKVKIICPIHGIFTQSVDLHKNGYGCRKCSSLYSNYKLDDYVEKSKKYNNKTNLYLVKLNLNNEIFYKIGITFFDLKIRFKNRIPYNYNIIKIINGDAKNMVLLESKILNYIASNNLKYKPNIIFGGYSECFKIDNIDTVISMMLDGF